MAASFIAIFLIPVTFVVVEPSLEAFEPGTRHT